MKIVDQKKLHKSEHILGNNILGVTSFLFLIAVKKSVL